MELDQKGNVLLVVCLATNSIQRLTNNAMNDWQSHVLKKEIKEISQPCLSLRSKERSKWCY